jgi:hypothetical protein
MRLRFLSFYPDPASISITWRSFAVDLFDQLEIGAMTTETPAGFSSTLTSSERQRRPIGRSHAFEGGGFDRGPLPHAQPPSAMIGYTARTYRRVLGVRAEACRRSLHSTPWKDYRRQHKDPRCADFGQPRLASHLQNVRTEGGGKVRTVHESMAYSSINLF